MPKISILNPKVLLPEISKTTVDRVSMKYTSAPLERVPKADEFVSATSKAKRSNFPKKTTMGDVWIEANRKCAEAYKKDLRAAVKEIPGAEFMDEFNQSSTKELDRVLQKLNERNEIYRARGFKGTIRDYVRATVFMPEADKNYVKIVEAMKKRGYKIADDFMEDNSGNLILDAAGKPKMKPDIDVRFGENAVPSGYEDVQLRFIKADRLYELIILPGPKYASFKNKEHKMVYENFRDYGDIPFAKGEGAKQIIKALKKEFHSLTRRLYKDALARDTMGTAVTSEPITFTKENITTINKLFKDLKNMYSGHFNALPPSKRTKADFKETKTYNSLDQIEKKLREVMKEYKPIE